MTHCVCCGCALEFGFIIEEGNRFCGDCFTDLFPDQTPEQVVDKHDQKEIEQDEFVNGGDNEND